MSGNGEQKTYPLEEALRAQKALRDLAGDGPEMFPLPAFVGMISDEIEALRRRGHSDEDIARTIESNSAITISAEQLAAYYAPSDERHSDRG